MEWLSCACTVPGADDTGVGSHRATPGLKGLTVKGGTELLNSLMLSKG